MPAVHCHGNAAARMPVTVVVVGHAGRKMRIVVMVVRPEEIPVRKVIGRQVNDDNHPARPPIETPIPPNRIWAPARIHIPVRIPIPVWVVIIVVMFDNDFLRPPVFGVIYFIPVVIIDVIIAIFAGEGLC